MPVAVCTADTLINGVLLAKENALALQVGECFQQGRAAIGLTDRLEIKLNVITRRIAFMYLFGTAKVHFCGVADW